jgi:predicted dehydrogenase
VGTTKVGGKTIIVRLAIVGGTASFHARSFSGLVNGVAPGESVPDGWPAYPQSVEDTRITAVWDEDRAAAEKLAQVFGIDHVMSTLEEVPAQCDGVIVTDDVTSRHYRHAPFFLERGIPTFIDKPLAPDSKTAESLVELAAKHGAPLMSGSALRYAAETEELRAHRDMLGRIELATAIGPNELFTYGIHPLELAHAIMGRGVDTVQNIGTADQDIVKVKYRDGRVLILLISRVLNFGFEMTLFGTEGRRRIVVSDDAAYYSNQLTQIAAMARDKQTLYPVDDALEVIRVLEAGVLSLKQGGIEINL